MTKQNTNQGFSIIEGLLILVVIGILGFTGWYVYHARSVASKDYVQTASQTSTGYPSWKQYCSDYGGVCFQYPTNWKLSNVGSTSNGPRMAVTSPSGKVVAEYTPFIDGVGGACPECSFKTLSVTKPTGSASSLRVVKGVLNNGSGSFTAIYDIMTEQQIAQLNLAPGQTAENTLVSALFDNPLNNPGQESLSIGNTVGNNASNPFDSESAAEAWLAQPEVTIAGKILSSAQQKGGSLAGILDIGEMLVHLQLSAQITDAVYANYYSADTTDKSPYGEIFDIGISTQSLANAGGGIGCSADHGALGQVIESTLPPTAPDANGAYVERTPDNKTLFQLGKFYYWYVAPQNVGCSGGQVQSSQVESDQSAFAKAFTTLQADGSN